MTYEELLNRLIDLRALAELPPKGERAGCMSSYDRASRYDRATDSYIDWGANDDGSGCIRALKDGSIVAFEAEGPGVIWRIWSALPQQGHMRVYLDGQEAPEIDVPFIDWFEKQPGSVPPLNLSELSNRLSRGRNSFIPIPYQKSCRVELAPGWGAYYHFTYTHFAPGTRVPHYGERFSREGMIALARVDRRLYERGEGEPNERAIHSTCEIPPLKSALLLDYAGEGAIRELVLHTDVMPSPAALRTLVLRVYWDNRKKAAVEAPLGDFFGGAPGYAHYRCFAMSMERDRFTCRFFMPFRSAARVEVENFSGVHQRVHMSFVIDDQLRGTENMLRFHAKWHRGFYGGIDAARFSERGDRWPDWPLLLVSGTKGRFCGVHLHIDNQWKEPAEKAETWWYGEWDKKSIDWWWGEGDEKFFVDGERFPSTFGTGSEDYIGYAWAAEPPFARFDSPYACLSAMPIDGNGHTGVSRFHIADNIPFSNSFEGFIEKYKGDEWEGNRCLYAATPYWYQQADVDDDYPSLSGEVLIQGYDGWN